VIGYTFRMASARIIFSNFTIKIVLIKNLKLFSPAKLHRSQMIITVVNKTKKFAMNNGSCVVDFCFNRLMIIIHKRKRNNMRGRERILICIFNEFIG
jgi:hypothetical protein